MIELRSYQRKAIDDLWAWFPKNEGHVCLSLPTGSGKSILLAAICEEAITNFPDTRILMLTHVKELIEQNARELLGYFPLAPLGIYSAGIGLKEIDRITFAGIQSIYKQAKKVGYVDLIVVDECFIKGTKISTPLGSKDIDLLRCGDVVYNQDGVGVVESISIKPSKDLYKLEFSDGTETVCTGNHKFFTKEGWREAKTLENGSYFFSPEGVSNLWKSIQALDKLLGRWEDKISDAGVALGKAKMLFDIMLEEVEQPNGFKIFKGENEKNVKEDRAQANKKRGERAIASLTSISTSPCSRGWVGGRVLCSNSHEAPENRLSNLLQDRYSKQRAYDWDRSRRFLSYVFGKEAQRQEKDRLFGISRLVNISCIERESYESVYNLQVSGHPSYFANGVLVHNCHLISHKHEGTYRKFIDELTVINPRLRVVGLTASPYRLGHGMITDKPALFDDLIEPISIEQLVRQGYLSRLTSKSTVQKYDLSGVHKRGGEYIESELQKAVNTNDNNEAAVKEILDRSHGRNHWLIFCTGIDHAIQIRDILNRNGVLAETLNAKTPKADRDRILADYKAGAIKALTNTNILTTGFNFPDIDLICLLRPTMSPGLYLQQVGRGLRLKSNKGNCLVLDFAGVVRQHGAITNIRPPSKKGEGDGVAPAKICPQCDEIVHASVMVCPECGFVFPPPTKEELSLREDDIMGDGIKNFNVTSWDWEIKKAKSGVDMIVVCYYGEMTEKPVYEYLTIWHTGYAGIKGMQKLTSILNRLGMLTEDYDDVAKLIVDAENKDHPTALALKQRGKFYDIVDKEWGIVEKKEEAGEIVTGIFQGEDNIWF